MRVIWSNSAMADLDKIDDYISKDNPKKAKDFVSTILKSTRLLSEQPKLGVFILSDGSSEYRKLILKNYIILYEINADRVNILMCFHGSKNIAYSGLIKIKRK